jgi:AcrR family transcriptional regulator
MAGRRVFAEHGFQGTTTKALAEAAGVSEALLFKHFPSKEAIFAATQASYSREQSSAEFGKLIAAEPSTATLVRFVHGFYSRLIEKGDEKDASDDATLARLCSAASRKMASSPGCSFSACRQTWLGRSRSASARRLRPAIWWATHTPPNCHPGSRTTGRDADAPATA